MNANPLNLFWEGYQFDSFTQIDDQSISIRLNPLVDRPLICSRCRQQHLKEHEQVEQITRQEGAIQAKKLHLEQNGK